MPAPLHAKETQTPARCRPEHAPSKQPAGDDKLVHDRHCTTAFRNWPKAKTKSPSRLTYAYLALGDCLSPAAPAERERAAVVVLGGIREHCARLGTVYTAYNDGLGGGPRRRARARADENAKGPHPVR